MCALALANGPYFSILRLSNRHTVLRLVRLYVRRARKITAALSSLYTRSRYGRLRQKRPGKKTQERKKKEIENKRTATNIYKHILQRYVCRCMHSLFLLLLSPLFPSTVRFSYLTSLFWSWDSVFSSSFNCYHIDAKLSFDIKKFTEKKNTSNPKWKISLEKAYTSTLLFCVYRLFS